MPAVSSYMCAIVTAAMMASISGACAQETRLKVPNVTVTAPAAPVEPPYMRDPWRSYGRNPYLGRYRVEEDKFAEVPCGQTRIGLGPSGKCLQGYRLTLGGYRSDRNSNPCDMALDVVIHSVGKLSIEADILILDPHKVTATGSLPGGCYVNSYRVMTRKTFRT